MTSNYYPHCYVDKMPMICVVGDAPIACSGQMVIGSPVRYVIMKVPTGAITGLSKYPYGNLSQASVASGNLATEDHLPTIENFWCRREEENVVRHPTKEDRAKLQIKDFLGEVYSLAQIGDTDAAGDKIFDFLDRALCDGLFTVCDDILSRVEVEKLPTNLMRSFLSITASAKRKLPSRLALFRKIESKLIELKGPEKAHRIIGNLA